MARDFPTGCRSKSSRTPQLDLVHSLVKPCSYGNHGRPGAQGAFRAWHLRGEIPASTMGPSSRLNSDSQQFRFHAECRIMPTVHQDTAAGGARAVF